MLMEAAAKRFEREHNGRVWLAWHIAALMRVKKLPDIKQMMLQRSSRPRQTWQQQLAIVTKWAEWHNAALAAKEQADGR